MMRRKDDTIPVAGPSTLSSDTVTQDVRVQAFPFFVPEQSNPEKREFLFAYRIVISNLGDRIVHLVSRHWRIINAEGAEQEVQGPGVVGKTPVLSPGESFEYVSFCPLDSEWGTMEGTYRLKDEDGEHFDVVIGRFFLTTTGPTMSPANS